jgi:nucleotide-binding universal stress UspA family protein
VRRVSQAGCRILVPLDGTQQAQRALAYASALARKLSGTVVLVRAGDPQVDSGLYSVRASEARLRQVGRMVDAQVIDGVDPASTIVQAARDCQADLIAIATAQSSDLGGWLNGSVTNAVVAMAHVPVLVIPLNWIDRNPLLAANENRACASAGWSA